MPNWCVTNYVITGDKKDIDDLYIKMKGLENREESLLPNGFGKTWLGNLVKLLGSNPDVLYCRGDWNSLKRDNDNTISFTTETAWARMTEFEQLITSTYDEKVSIWFITEEPGFGIFETNDAKSLFFPDQFMMDHHKLGSDYMDEEQLLKSVSRLARKKITTVDEAFKWARRYNDWHTARDKEGFCYIRQADLVD